MENLITQLQTALQELVNERDTYKRQLEEQVRQSQRDAASGNSQEDFVKGFRACIARLSDTVGRGVNYSTHYSDYAYIGNLEVQISGDVEVEIDGEELLYDKAKLNLSDDEIVDIYNMMKAEGDE